jgi:hypothetical protein
VDDRPPTQEMPGFASLERLELKKVEIPYGHRLWTNLKQLKHLEACAVNSTSSFWSVLETPHIPQQLRTLAL